MAIATSFEELEIWKLARVIVRDIYTDFKDVRDFVFRNQIIGAGISIMNNISEGWSRESNREFRFFSNISKGSVGEVKNMYYIGEDQKYIASDTAKLRRDVCEKEKNMIAKFRNSLKK